MVTVHVEACDHLHRVVQRITGAGAKAGVALNPATPPDSLSEIVADVDCVLVMSVDPGFGGQAFIPASVRKVRAGRAHDRATRDSCAVIEVDGGIDAATRAARGRRRGAAARGRQRGLRRHRPGRGAAVDPRGRRRRARVMAVPPQEPRKGRRGYALKRVEKAVELSRQSWPEFWRDLAIRTAAVAVAVAILVGLAWLLLHR